MIEVTCLDDSKMMINAQMIQSLQSTPDTVITLTTNGKLLVKEPVDVISERIIRYQRSTHEGLPYILCDNNPSHSKYPKNAENENFGGIEVHTMRMVD